MRWIAMWMIGLGLAGCGPWEAPVQGELEVEYTDCSDGAECVVVELGCCDECNGGAAVATREDQVGAVVDAYSEPCGLSTACTQMACAPLSAECIEGRCAVVRE